VQGVVKESTEFSSIYTHFLMLVLLELSSFLGKFKKSNGKF